MTLKVLKANPNLKLKQAKLAIIDIGSNSIRMLIYDDFTSSRVPFFNEKAVCELGKNLDKSTQIELLYPNKKLFYLVLASLNFKDYIECTLKIFLK
jgi:hypothetical protein